ncbi:GNAT family N-acetyltransferase [Lysobacter sp. MMG2]|uniref:arsenic resistance N-acetyltransferase ArsN2 n=1 Tax=Lysobacter sp. MMG2 TaxID=2801338 RepID=UPI001C212012|nr:arsenic resistance N-acetyltransferase ArsN2 [Lysobacter sp. MMG2]MBU8975882.1 GNAT family N-acetyltransferase [Lysobacter sp. MMG2]
MIVRPLAHDEEPRVRALLVEAALPVEDLDQSNVHFMVAVDDDATIGAIGLEVFGPVGLLRSLVVRPEARGDGTGGRLVDALESFARTNRVSQLVLLTQTAAAFFAHRGYAVIDRAAAPAEVQRSAEFRSLCPASATCMIKVLEQTP